MIASSTAAFDRNHRSLVDVRRMRVLFSDGVLADAGDAGDESISEYFGFRGYVG